MQQRFKAVGLILAGAVLTGGGYALGQAQAPQQPEWVLKFRRASATGDVGDGAIQTATYERVAKNPDEMKYLLNVFNDWDTRAKPIDTALGGIQVAQNAEIIRLLRRIDQKTK